MHIRPTVHTAADYYCQPSRKLGTFIHYLLFCCWYVLTLPSVQYTFIPLPSARVDKNNKKLPAVAAAEQQQSAVCVHSAVQLLYVVWAAESQQQQSAAAECVCGVGKNEKKHLT